MLSLAAHTAKEMKIWESPTACAGGAVATSRICFSFSWHFPATKHDQENTPRSTNRNRKALQIQETHSRTPTLNTWRDLGAGEVAPRKADPELSGETTRFSATLLQTTLPPTIRPLSVMLGLAVIVILAPPPPIPHHFLWSTKTPIKKIKIKILMNHKI